MARTPMAVGELQVLLALCRAAPQIDTTESAERFVKQIHPYFLEAHDQSFAASHFLTEIEPSPWEALNYGLISAVLAVGIRHTSLHELVYGIVGQYLDKACEYVSNVSSSGSFADSTASLSGSNNLSVLTMSLLGFLEASALYCQFFRPSEQYQVVRKLRSLFTGDFLTAVSGAFSAIRASPGSTVSLKEKKLYILRYDEAERPPSGTLLQQSFMRLLLSCSSMQVATVPELQHNDVLDVLISREGVPNPLSDSGKALPLVEILAAVVAETMQILEDGSDYLELGSSQDHRLNNSVKARALTIFLCCLLVNDEIADPELMLGWLRESLPDEAQMSEENFAGVVLKTLAVMAKTSMRIAQDLSKVLPRFIVQAPIQGATMAIAAESLSVILQELSSDNVINGLHSLGNMLNRDPNTEAVNGNLAPPRASVLRSSPAESSISLNYGAGEEQVQLAQLNIIRTIVIVASKCRDKATIPLALSILLQKITRINSAVDTEIITHAASLVARGGEVEFMQLVKGYDRLNHVALVGNNEVHRQAILSGRNTLARLIDHDSPLFKLYGIHLMETIVRKGDIHEEQNDVQADVDLAAREIGDLLEPLSILASKYSKEGQAFNEGEIAVLQREAWFNIVVHGIVPGNKEFTRYIEALQQLALHSLPLVAENRIDKTESDIELNPVLRRGMNGPRHAKLKMELITRLPHKESDIKKLSYPQTIFFHAAYMVETLRAQAGNCVAVLQYFIDPTVTQGGGLETMRGIADKVMDLYLTKVSDKNRASSAAPQVAKQLAKVFVTCCHRIPLCQQVAATFADKIVDRMPAALCQKSALFALLECLSLMWTSCLEAEFDEYEWRSTYTSARGHITLHLPDNFDYRRATLNSLHRRARQWLTRIINVAPLDVKGLLQTYLAEFDDEGAYGHVVLGRSFAMEIGATIPASDYRLRAIERQGDLAANTASDFIAQYTTRQEYKFADALPGYDEEWFRLLRVNNIKKQKPHNADNDMDDAVAVLAVLERRLAEHKFVASNEIRDILRRAAALLCRSRHDQSALISHLVEIPFRQFTKQSIQLGVALWVGVINENPRLESRIVLEVMRHWESTVQRRINIFDDRKPFLDPFFIKEEFGPSDREALQRQQHRERSIIAPHNRILQFLSSHFNAVRFGSVDLRRAFRRLMSITMHGLRSASAHPLTREFHFQVIMLALNMLRSSDDMETSAQWRLKDSILSTALTWFAHAPRWTFGGNRIQTKAECQLMSDVIAMITMTSHVARERDSWLASLPEKEQLLIILLESEIARLQVWLAPLGPDQKQNYMHTRKTTNIPPALVKIAWQHSPGLAIQLAARFQQQALLREVREYILNEPASSLDEPEALQMLYENGLPLDVGPQQLKYLLFWAPVNPITAVTFFSPNYRSHPFAVQYAMRAVESHSTDVVFFYVPQIVQTLRYDALGYVQRYIIETAKFSQLFAHQIIWNMKANAYKDETATVEDPLKPTLDIVTDKMISSWSGADKAFYEKEFAFFGEVTDVSGKLKPYIKREKSEKKAKIEEELRKIKVEVGVYLPSNPDGVVVDIDRKSGKPLQSHAKAPYMATFRIRKNRNDDDDMEETEELIEDETNGDNKVGTVARSNTYEVWQSAIFKVGDDCRQDLLALQMIAAFRGIFNNIGLDVYVYPYRVTATAPGCGVIDVLPNSISRDMLGREAVNGLYDYFVSKYGGEDSVRFQEARSNFVKSMAAYSVISYLLQFKDRHNGNIMVDDAGHILHIDFGFCFDIAPGGVKFERAPFKLTTEMVHVMGGSNNSQSYKWFEELCVKAFLASRPYTEKLCHMVMLMTDSGLPCFKPETIQHFRERFVLEKSERDAAQFMRDLVKKSQASYSTGIYDQFQLMTNGIPY